MAITRIGKVRFSVDGVYDPAATYDALSTVTNAACTKVYASLVDNNTGNPLTDTAKWRCIIDAETPVDAATKRETVTKTAEDTSAEIEANKMYEFPEMSALDIMLSAPVEGELNEWQFAFNSGGSATVLSVPEGVVWTSAVTIEANMHYEVNIVYNGTNGVYYGILVGWAWTAPVEEEGGE